MGKVFDMGRCLPPRTRLLAQEPPEPRPPRVPWPVHGPSTPGHPDYLGPFETHNTVEPKDTPSIPPLHKRGVELD